MSDTEEPEDRRTEGVRIIGAQEAAEAAARPDVVRRRTRREKRYGDRPDQPEPASDLPKITISTTETEGRDPDRFGAVPVVRPGEQGDQRPRWADDEAQPEPTEHFGHARIVDESQQPQEAAEPEDLSGEDAAPPPSAATWEDESGLPTSDTVDEATQQWSAQDFASAEVADEGSEASEAGLDRAWESLDQPLAAEDDEDDSFVLPHWTEPPTGQVPKVVIGDDAPDPESLATYGSQPRWRDEGERGIVTDFDDLIDDGPRLGALGTDDSVEDDFFSDANYDDDGYFDAVDDDTDGAADDELDDVDGFDDPDAGAPPLRRARAQRPRRAPAPDEGRGSGDRDLVTAVGVGVGLVAVGLLCFALGPIATAALATVVVTVAAWEYFAAVRSSGHNPATLLGLASVVGLMIAAFTSGLAAYPVVLGLSVIAGLLWYLWVAPGERGVQNLGLTMLGVMWIGVLGSFATLFLGLGDVVQDGDATLTSNPGIGVLIAAIVAAVSHDVGAYFIGRFFGKTPLSAASPNKTQEGMAGGVLVSLAATVVVVGIVGIEPIGSDLAQTFVFALLCAIAAPLGDLAESFVKRDLAIKDMGSVLPGHGGVLDRFDAVLFVLPVAYFVTLLFDIWSGVGS